MTDVYHYDQINAETEVYGVVADPIGHSLSPVIHNASFAHLGLNKIYVPFRVPREDLDQFIDDAPAMGIKGLSITIPHKEDVVKKMTEVEPVVRGIGALNTVIFDGDARRGFNTDHEAAMISLETAMGLAGKGAKPFHGKIAMVLGAGGVGMGIVYGLVARGAQVVIADAVSRRAHLAGQAIRLPLGRMVGPPRQFRPTSSSIARRSACTPTSTNRRSTNITCGRRWSYSTRSTIRKTLS